MSLIKYLQLQPIDDSTESSASSDVINLNEPINEGELTQFWDQVVRDVQTDPDWFTFDDK